LPIYGRLAGPGLKGTKIIGGFIYLAPIFNTHNNMTKETPKIHTTPVQYRDRPFEIEYFRRAGNKETILFLHGLGGAKENYWDACKAKALDGHTLICVDNPGTGNSTYYEDFPLNLDDLTNITSLFIEQLNITDFIFVGSSMGGLTSLLYLRGKGSKNVKAFINIEGNLMPEDCMFSSKVVVHDFITFSKEVFPRTIREMKSVGNAGYHIIANNLELNTNVRSYYDYSFQTVAYSGTGELLEQYLLLDLPKLFIYGEENKHLSYLPEMVKRNMNTRSISESNHFVFYDHPKELYEVIAGFINSFSR
jgi:pimeloyl-ACP methyl ester carboxylesterase